METTITSAATTPSQILNGKDILRRLSGMFLLKIRLDEAEANLCTCRNKRTGEMILWLEKESLRMTNSIWGGPLLPEFFTQDVKR